MEKLFTGFANYVSSLTGRPWSFVVAFAFIVIWGASGPLFGFSDTWQLVVNTSTTVITFLMVFLIQNSQNRDAAAMQAKLDEVIRSVDGARNEFIGVEHLTGSKLEEIRAALEKECGDGDDDTVFSHESVTRLLSRR